MTTKDIFSGRRTRREILKGASVLGGGVLAMPYLGRLAFAEPVEPGAEAHSGAGDEEEAAAAREG